MAKWQGYQRFCSLARALDVIGDRWTLLIVQELMHKERRYNDLKRRLPGIGNNVLADRLDRLCKLDVLQRRIEGSQTVVYGLGVRGEALLPAMAELRRWGADEQLQLTNHAPDCLVNNMKYGDYSAESIETYQWIIDGTPFVLELDGDVLTQKQGIVEGALIELETSAEFMRELMVGTITWDEGRKSGKVLVRGSDASWVKMQQATAYPFVTID